MDILKDYRADKATLEKEILNLIKSFSDKYETHVSEVNLYHVDSLISTGDPILFKVSIRDNILSKISE